MATSPLLSEDVTESLDVGRLFRKKQNSCQNSEFLIYHLFSATKGVRLRGHCKLRRQSPIRATPFSIRTTPIGPDLEGPVRPVPMNVQRHLGEPWTIGPDDPREPIAQLSVVATQARKSCAGVNLGPRAPRLVSPDLAPASSSCAFEASDASQGDLDMLRVSVEFARGSVAAASASALGEAVKRTFEVTPEVVVLSTGTLAREFESSVKAPRFADRRQ
jgi:hypothetical protein